MNRNKWGLNDYYVDKGSDVKEDSPDNHTN